MLIFCFYNLTFLENRIKFITTTCLFISFISECLLLTEKKKQYEIYKIILLFKLLQILVYSKENSFSMKDQCYGYATQPDISDIKSFNISLLNPLISSIQNKDPITEASLRCVQIIEESIPELKNQNVRGPEQLYNNHGRTQSTSKELVFDTWSNHDLIKNAWDFNFHNISILIFVFISYLYHMILYVKNNNKKILKLVFFITWIVLFTYNIDDFNLKHSYLLCSIQILCYTIIYITSFSYKTENQCKLNFITLCKELVENSWFIFCNNIIFLIVLFPIQLFVKFYLYKKLKMMKKNHDIVSTQFV